MTGEKTDVKIKQDDTGGGIKITPTPGEIPPPLAEAEVFEEAEKKAEEVAAKRVVGSIPILPGVVKPPLRFEGQILAEMTGYPGFIYTEEDLEDIAQLIAECGWTAPPQIQVLIALLGLHATKGMGYIAWRRQGRPDDLRKREKVTGEVKKTERPPGEKVTQ